MQDNYYNIILDGRAVKGNPGETILELSRRNNVAIPTLCHDDRLEPFTSCFVCVVEVEGMRGHQPACSTRVTEGMKIVTDSDSIRKSRKVALELLLSNHYADCVGPCKLACPAGVDVQGYISLIEKGLYSEAVALIKEQNPLPAICGRVCVRRCEVDCRRNLAGEGTGVGIDYLKRFAADRDLESDTKYAPNVQPSTGKKVAVIGAGPGGLSAAYFLQVKGYQADIYEASEKSGGWLRYGIPEYRLPNNVVDKEVKNITDLGVRIHYNMTLGGNLSYNDLKDNYDSLILTIGSQRGTGIGCEGDDAGNVFPGIGFLRNMEATGQKYDFTGKTVAVIGGGNTAMDCCRTSIRCKADKVYVIYRRTEREMPANPIEIHESKLEGVEYMFLTLPKVVNKDQHGNLKSITCLRMELGEPDASGRRRPVAVEGSEFTIEVDYALAAIGQKTDVNFIDDINTYAKEGALVINKWGDIDAHKDTLQTGIPSVFAAGDGVTGPATIVEAIAQARIAVESAHQYMTGLQLQKVKSPFVSSKEIFKKQTNDDYSGRFVRQEREEMPTLPAESRFNFNEVELGYYSDEVAVREARRCLECGCAAFHNCDLQRYATEYNAHQKSFNGEHKEYKVDFRHPYIEIDNNKCILCGRCIRICREVAGANALGFINRGFDTYVAPSMGNALQDTNCDSCGLCLSTCPTGALTENVLFKPGPVLTESARTICNYCSIGCSVKLNHRNGFVMSVTGDKGVINTDGNLCRYPKFGYAYMNDASRITRPLLKKGGKLTEITFGEAFNLMKGKILSVKPDENAFFAGARLTNEEMYLIRKLATAAVRTNNVGSFQYLSRGVGYSTNCRLNVPVEMISNARKIYLLDGEINLNHPIVGFFIQNARLLKKIPVSLITGNPANQMNKRVDELVSIKSNYHFIKAVNHYLLATGKENRLFITDRTGGFEHYKDALLAESYSDLVRLSGVEKVRVETFADDYNSQMNAVLIFSEKDNSSAVSLELFNLAMITGKLGKTASGLISLKEKNNSQGLFDMGIAPGIGKDLLSGKSVKNYFIFGEDPVGCALSGEPAEWIKGADFVMVQDYFLTPTADLAHLILPATFPAETGGSFTNTQKVIQHFEAALNPGVSLSNIDQLGLMIKTFGLPDPGTPNDVFMEFVSTLSETNHHEPLDFCITKGDDSTGMFNSGCDVIVRRFEEEYNELLLKAF